MAGAIVSQTLCAALLSLGSGARSSLGAPARTTAPDDDEEAQGSADLALLGLLVAALVQLALVGRWWHAIRVRDGEAGRGGRRAGEGEGEGGGGGEGRGAGGDEAEMGLLAAGSDSEGDEGGLLRAEELEAHDGVRQGGGGGLLGRKERLELRRGTRALRAAAGTVVASWACFVWNVVRG